MKPKDRQFLRHIWILGEVRAEDTVGGNEVKEDLCSQGVETIRGFVRNSANTRW